MAKATKTAKAKKELDPWQNQLTPTTRATLSKQFPPKSLVLTQKRDELFSKTKRQTVRLLRHEVVGLVNWLIDMEFIVIKVAEKIEDERKAASSVKRKVLESARRPPGHAQDRFGRIGQRRCQRGQRDAVVQRSTSCYVCASASPPMVTGASMRRARPPLAVPIA